MKSQDLHESETPPPSSNLQPKEQKLKDAVMKLFRSRYSSESPLLQAQKIKLIEENISSFFSGLKTRPTHPPYATMVMTAIKEINEGGGSNVDEISKYIEANFQGLPFAHSQLLKHYVAKLVDSGKILYSYSNACYALPDISCEPYPGREKEHEQQQQEKKRSRGRLRKKYLADDEEGDGLVESGDLRNSLEDNFAVQTDSIQLGSNNNEDLMELGKKGKKHQQVDYSNIVIGLEANPLQYQRVDYANMVIGLVADPLQQQQLMWGGRPRRIQVNQQGTVEQHHQSFCAKPVLETGKRRPRKIHAHQQETVEKQHHNVTSKPVAGVDLVLNRRSERLGRPLMMPVEQETAEQCNPNGDTGPVDEIQEGPLQQRQSKRRGRPCKIHADQQEIVEQHHQSAGSKPVFQFENELGLLQKPCRGRPLGMQVEEETVEQCNPTSDSNAVVENEGESSQQQQSKRRGRPPKKPVNQDTVKDLTPIVESNTVAGIEVGPLHQSFEPQGVPSKICEAEQSEMSDSIPIFYGGEDGLIVLGDGNTLTSVIEAPAMENQPPRMVVAKEGDAEQIYELGIIEQQYRNINANLAVGTEVGYVQAEMGEKCETEHAETIQTFYGDGNSLTSVIEAPSMENQHPRMALAKEGDIEKIHQVLVGTVEQQHRNIDVNLAVGTEVSHLQEEMNEKCETEQAEMSGSIQTFYGDEDGLMVLGNGNSLASEIEALPLEGQPPWMALAGESDTEQIHEEGMIEQQQRNIDVNLAVGTEVGHMQAEVNDKCETEQAQMSESIQMLYGDEDGLIVLDNGNSLASVIEALPLGCQPPWMDPAEEGDPEQIHREGTIKHKHRDEDGLIVVGNGNGLTSVNEAPPMENQPPWMAVAKEGDTEQLHQQGILEKQHRNMGVNLAVVIEIGQVQKEQQLNHRGRTIRTHKQSKTELVEKSESMGLCADDSTDGGLTGEVFPDKRLEVAFPDAKLKKVAFPVKRRKEVVTLQQLQTKRQLRPRPHEPHKGRLRKLKQTTYHL